MPLAIDFVNQFLGRLLQALLARNEAGSTKLPLLLRPPDDRTDAPSGERQYTTLRIAMDVTHIEEVSYLGT